MQISNSVAAPVGSHADPANASGPLATQILSGGSRAQQPATGKSTSGSTAPAAPVNPAGIQNGGPVSDLPSQRVGRPGRGFTARREARAANEQTNAIVSGVPVAATNPAAQPAQFLTILGDVQDAQAGVAKAQAKASYILSELATASGTSYAMAPSAVTNPDAKPAAAAKPADSGSQQDDTAAPNATQQAATRTIDALLETDPAVVSQVGNESSTASPSDVAFAARILFKTTDPSVIAPHGGQASIAASRFEGLALGGGRQTAPQPTATARRTAQPAAESGVPPQPEEPVAVVASQFDGMSADSGSGEPRGHAEANASAAANSVSSQSAGTDQNTKAAQASGPAAQPATVSPAIAVQASESRTQGAPSNSGATVAKTAAAGQVASNALPGTQNVSAGMVAAPASVDAASGRGPAITKPAQPEHAAQYVEAQNEPAARAAEAVRDISLNLSTKDQNVQVRLSERAGELHVTVRTPDSTLTHGLREGLSDLMGRLERGGYRAETWQPAGSDTRDRGQESSRRGFSQQQNAGGKGSGRQQNSQDSESESETPKWIGELESSFQKE